MKISGTNKVLEFITVMSSSVISLILWHHLKYVFIPNFEPQAIPASQLDYIEGFISLIIPLM